jgi:hypothetical protein
MMMNKLYTSASDAGHYHTADHGMNHQSARLNSSTGSRGRSHNMSGQKPSFGKKMPAKSGLIEKEMAALERVKAK